MSYACTHSCASIQSGGAQHTKGGNTVSEKSSLPEDKDTGRYGYIIYGGLGLGVILILGFIAFIVYDNYHVPAEKKNYAYTFPVQPKSANTRIWYVNPAGEVKMSL